MAKQRTAFQWALANWRAEDRAREIALDWEVESASDGVVAWHEAHKAGIDAAYESARADLFSPPSEEIDGARETIAALFRSAEGGHLMRLRRSAESRNRRLERRTR